LYRLTSKLRDFPNIVDEELRDLCRDCDVAATELLAALEQLKIRGTKTTWKSLGKALRSIWGERKMASLEKRLAGYRDAIELRVLVNFRYRTTS
jgi:hypothetical protein